MPEGLGLGLEAPVQDIDFIPIAGSSTDEPELLWNEKTKAESEEDLVQVNKKRKVEEHKDTPTSAPESKKSRRINKGRSKRVKL